MRYICDIFIPLSHSQLSEEGRGVASIANMLTITRIHNSVSAAAAMRRQDTTDCIISCNHLQKHATNKLINNLCVCVCVHRVVQLARDYATRRTAFGKLLKDHPLHIQTLARMEVSWQGVNILHTTVSPIMPHPCFLLTGGDSWSVPAGDGCVSSVGPGGVRHCNPA